MSESIKNAVLDAIREVGPHPDLVAFLTVHEAVRTTTSSDAARAYHDGAQVTLYSDEGTEYYISFASLVDELLMLAALDTERRLREEEWGEESD
ncbi:MAG: hypothetical protein ACTHYR_15995 [Brachybacterium sp.]